jgi:hypothetical protein
MRTHSHWATPAPVRWVIQLLAILAAGCLAAGVGAASVSADTAGTVHFVRMADSSFDQYTLDPSPAAQQWLTTHMWRMGVYSPYFDSRTSWYRSGWVYDDAYAIYRGSQLETQHPEWILRDAAGNMLYIPFGCSGGTCPQYAGDISNPAFRRDWIEKAAAEFARGYRGVFVDDVNMDMQVGNGDGQSVAPVDPTTGQAMTPAQWRAYMAVFMQELRQALPSAEIAHNVIWFADKHAGATDASIRSELSSADFIYLERGVNDTGLTGGTGSWSVSALLSYIDEIHALGRSIVLDGTSPEAQGLEYNLAAYLLVSTGGDAVSGGGQTPENWWAGWNVNLGQASAGRFAWSGLLRRDFTGGMTLVNPPGEPTRTVTVPRSLDLSGNAVTSVTLPPASGAVLTAIPAGPAPAAQSAVLTETQTTLQATAGLASPHRPVGAPRHESKRHRAQRRGHPRGGARAVVVRGSVNGAPRGRVAIVLEARRNGHWTRVRVHFTRVNARELFSCSLRLSRAVRYRVRAMYEGARGLAPSRSSYLSLP